MAITKFSISEPGVKSNKFWDQDTAQGALIPISSVTVASGTDTSIGFTGIPQTFQDLMLVLNTRRTDAVTEGTQFLYTNFSGSIASATKLISDGATTSSSRNTAQNAAFIGAYPGANAQANIFGSQIVHILNYSSTSQFKTLLCRTASDRNGAGQTELSVSLFRDNGAITSIGVSTYNASVYYLPGSTATLYGIRTGG
jgi:hypothetical protein